MTVLDLRRSKIYKPIFFFIIVSSAGVFSSHGSLHPTRRLYQVRLGRNKTVYPDDLMAAGL